MSRHHKPITIVQGGQYGSEAKGAIAAVICEREGVDIAVRTGATNAGHTVYYNRAGQDFPVAVKMQQLPVGWVNPDTDLVLGAGALIDPVILANECDIVSRLTGADIRKRLYIDYRAGIHEPRHAELSKSSGRHHAIGATGKGCSEALIDRIQGRGHGAVLFGARPDLIQGYNVIDTEAVLNDKLDAGAKLLLEGTQGQLLDLYLGPYPYTTHKQCGPAQWMLECGLSPALPTDIVMVVRTFPIRVAGNSGPLPLEISWPELAREINGKRESAGLPALVSDDAIQLFELAVEQAAREFKIPLASTGTDQHNWSPKERVQFQAGLSEINKVALTMLGRGVQIELEKLFEMTTVTKKLRRVARLSRVDLIKAARQMRPHRVALTFMNYEFPEWWGDNLPCDSLMTLPEDQALYAQQVGGFCQAPVRFASYGPESKHVIG